MTFKTKLFSHVFVKSQRPSQNLIVVLHGRGDSYEGFSWLPAALQLDDVNYLMVNAPDPYYGGFSWYDLPPDQLPGIKRSSALLDRLFAELEEQGYRAADSVLFGFSQGCLMALEWGARSSLCLRGFVALSGYCYNEIKLADEFSATALQTKWLITHGTRDEVLPYKDTEKQIRYLQSKGFPAEFHSFPKSHTIDEVKELPLIRKWLRTVFDTPRQLP